MSTKKYTCNLCAGGTTKSNYESIGCCAKCKEKLEKAKKLGKNCGICKAVDNEMFIKFNGLCNNCNNKRCGLEASEVKTEINELPVEGTPGDESDQEKKTNTKKEIVDQLMSAIVQSYAEIGLDKNIDRTGFVLFLKTTLNEILENELSN